MLSGSPRRRLVCLVGASLGLACSSTDDTAKSTGPDAAVVAPDSGGGGGAPDEPGRYTVGTTRIELPAHDGRTLPVQLWYPAVASARAEAEAGHPLAEIEPPGERRDTLAGLVGAAPAGCTSREMHAAIDADPLGEGRFPVLLFSHCHQCTRFSELAVAERLASHGFVVAAPDHEGNTLYDQLAGVTGMLTPEFLQVRGADMKDVLDAVLGGTGGMPAALTARLDADRVGMFGHSFGSITTGLVLQDDARVKVGVFMAAPPENPLLPGVTLANLTKPALFFLAEEDNSIMAIGNQFIQQNYDAYPAPAWLLSVKDAGHWSFSDIAGITDAQAPGCGEGKRQEPPNAPFNYLPNETGRSIAQAYVTAFFASELGGDAAATAYLGAAHPEGTVTIVHRE